MTADNFCFWLMGDINHQIKLSKAHEGDNAPLGDSIFSGYKPGQRC